jgi:hypothetical protein
MGEPIGFVDINNEPICCNDIVETYDRQGRKWTGKIKPVDPSCILKSNVVENGGTLYEFSPPSSYGTWINDQDYASKLEIINSKEVPVGKTVG